MAPWDQLNALAHNLWWSWDTEATELWRDIHPEEWRRCNHDPVALLQQLSPQTLARAPLAERIDAAHTRMARYLSADAWAQEHAQALRQVAYLSMEFGLHESMPLYSGGLGVLAGDHLRSASDLGLPMVAIGILWREGYFRQELVNGEQQARYERLDPEHSALHRVEDAAGPLTIEVPIGDRTCALGVWRLDVGRVPLYLLDAGVAPNPEDFQALTSRLYGGDHSVRVRQEAILGLGAIRLLRALDLHPQAIHLNEGHCAFATLQAAADELDTAGSWVAACDAVRPRFVFTTHTPVPAGHDRFGWADIDACLGPWRTSLGLSEGDFMDLGRVDPTDLDEPLCMTVLALRLSAAANGVSRLHGAVSREMWAAMWPEIEVEQVPIGHVTNGVHSTFWVADPTRALFDAHLPGWRERPWAPEVWAPASQIADAPIEELRRANRAALLEVVRQRCGLELDPEKLTIGFARRFAPYKRGDLVFREPDRLAAWLDRGAQLIYAGKAHPRDLRGQAIVARVAELAADPRFAGRVVLIPDYDIEVGRRITAGADIWLNNPRRPREASGTSGQKVVYNGGLNLSVLDGWWPEGYDGTNGWAIGDGSEWADVQAGDTADATALIELLEGEIWACWQDRSAWCERIRRSWTTCAPAFSSHRMVRDYALDLYLPRALAGTG